MPFRQKARLALMCAPLLFAVQATAQEPGAPNATPNPGRDMVVGKCFQCHNDSMFRDLRQDRRAWEGTIYRMIGRGGLWTQDEIKLMADFLGTDYGPNAKPAAAQAR
jgi:mono/diheme cytochrome c family protein